MGEHSLRLLLLVYGFITQNIAFFTVSLSPEYNDHSELLCTQKHQKGLEFPQRI